MCVDAFFGAQGGSCVLGLGESSRRDISVGFRFWVSRRLLSRVSNVDARPRRVWVLC